MYVSISSGILAKFSLFYSNDEEIIVWPLSNLDWSYASWFFICSNSKKKIRSARALKYFFHPDKKMVVVLVFICTRSGSIYIIYLNSSAHIEYNMDLLILQKYFVRYIYVKNINKQHKFMTLTGEFNLVCFVR